MRIERMRISRFASFEETDWIELSGGLNVVVGENNSGKSAFLKCIDSSIPNRPHVNDVRYSAGDVGRSLVEFDIRISTEEYRKKLSVFGQDVAFSVQSSSATTINLVHGILNSKDDLVIKCRIDGDGGIQCREPTLTQASPNPTATILVRIVNGVLTHTGSSIGPSDTAFLPLVAHPNSSIFNFSAQRLNLATSSYGYEQRLTPNASNLPSVLSYLQSSRKGVFDEIIDRLREVISGVDYVTVGPNSSGQQQIRLLTDRGSTREELTFGLETGGTGVSQVLAILTAVTTSDSSVIVVDEFNSFLHPAAAKKLLSICRTFYSQHQYIISTHSPEVLTFDGVDQIFLVERSGYRSTITPLDTKGSHDRRNALRQIGVSMLDVLGVEHAIWVEGPTEEICFPLIMKRASQPLPSNLGVFPLASTGDFSRRGTTIAAVVKIYRTAMASIAPLVAGASFTLDRDGLSDESVAAIERSTDGNLLILPRRNIESYFIDCDALSDVIWLNIADLYILPNRIKDILLGIGGHLKYKAAGVWKEDLENPKWLEKVDGALLLKDLFNIVSENRLEYSKTVHGPQIVARISLEHVSGLINHISRLRDVALGESRKLRSK